MPRVTLSGDRLTVTGGADHPRRRPRPDHGRRSSRRPSSRSLRSPTGRSTITGIGHIRHHETDRLAALAAELNKLGGQVTELEDGLEIEPRPLSAGTWLSYHDHRMATTGAIVGLMVPGVVIENIATTAKTLPQFPELWTAMLAGNVTG